MTATVTDYDVSTRKTIPDGGPWQAGRTGDHRGSMLRALRKGVPIILAAALLGGGSWLGWKYLTEWRFEISTDDAYVEAHVVAVSSQVAGDLAEVRVNDNDRVKAGQVLAVVDQRQYRAAVANAEAAVAQAKAAITTDEAEIAQQQAVVDEIEATIVADKATAAYAAQNDQRFGTLAKDGYGSVQQAQQAESDAAAATANVAKDQATLEAAQRQITTLQAELEQAKATLAGEEAQLEAANINLGYTTITAPVDGVVGNLTLRIGQYVQAGTQLLDVVPLGATYVVANYKETQLGEVRAGQPARFTVDTYPGLVVHGRVDSLAPASGQEFALLPPDNATGNFTKIVQRIPVKIDVDASDRNADVLRPGMSVTATIDVRGPATAAPAGQGQ